MLCVHTCVLCATVRVVCACGCVTCMCRTCVSPQVAFLFHRKRFTDPDNQIVVKSLMRETKAQEPTAALSDVRGKDVPCILKDDKIILVHLCLDAIRKFFQTKLEEAALKEKGTYDTKVTKQRRRNRIMKVN